MMKKLFWLVLSTSILAWQGVFAQEVNPEAQTSQKEDSLQQVVSELSSRVQKVEESSRNERIWKKRAKYFNIGYIANQTLTDKQDADAKWKSDFGASLTFGKTYYLHKKPLLNMIKFGIDATWADLSYVKYSEPDEFADDGRNNPSYNSNSYYEEEESDFGIHQIDVAMHVGPSVTVNPVGDLKVALYFHYVPTYSMVLIDDTFGHGFVSNFAFGASIAYKAISFGIENRWANKATYNGLSFDDDEEDYDYSGNNPNVDDFIKSDKLKMKSKSFRIFLSFRY